MKVRLGYIGCASEVNAEDMNRLKPYGYKFAEIPLPNNGHYYKERTHKITSYQPELELKNLEELAELIKALGSCVIKDNSVEPVSNGLRTELDYDGISIDVFTDYI